MIRSVLLVWNEGETTDIFHILATPEDYALLESVDDLYLGSDTTDDQYQRLMKVSASIHTEVEYYEGFEGFVGRWAHCKKRTPFTPGVVDLVVSAGFLY